MEWAVHTGDASFPGAWDDLMRPSNGEAAIADRDAGELLSRVIGGIAPTRAYVGNEFCENLIPSRERLERICHSFWRSGVEITCLTPPITDEGIGKLRPLFGWLAQQQHDVEVVFNDWGTLSLLHQEFPGLAPIQGRLLNKVLRDPRVTPSYNSPDAPEGIRAAMQPSGLDTPYLQHLLAKYGVKAVELDACRQDSDLHFEELPFRVDVYFPYGFVTTGRQCMIGSLHLEESDRFRPGSCCQQACRQYVTESRFSSTLGVSGADGRCPASTVSFYQRGNTFFYCLETDVLKSFLLAAESCGVGRLIYEPSLPM